MSHRGGAGARRGWRMTWTGTAAGRAGLAVRAPGPARTGRPRRLDWSVAVSAAAHDVLDALLPPAPHPAAAQEAHAACARAAGSPAGRLRPTAGRGARGRPRAGRRARRGRPACPRPPWHWVSPRQRPVLDRHPGSFTPPFGRHRLAGTGCGSPPRPRAARAPWTRPRGARRRAGTHDAFLAAGRDRNLLRPVTTSTGGRRPRAMMDAWPPTPRSRTAPTCAWTCCCSCSG